MNQPDYIESREGGYWIRGTSVSLDSVVYRFLEGLSPETIQADCFPYANSGSGLRRHLLLSCQSV